MTAKPEFIEHRRIVSIDYVDGRSSVYSAFDPSMSAIERQIKDGLLWVYPLQESDVATFAEDRSTWKVGIILDDVKSVGIRIETIKLQLISPDAE